MSRPNWLQDFGMKKPAEARFTPEYGRTYSMVFQVQGNTLSLEIDGKAALSADDSTLSSGMVGLGALSMGRSFFGDLHVTEL